MAKYMNGELLIGLERDDIETMLEYALRKQILKFGRYETENYPVVTGLTFHPKAKYKIRLTVSDLHAENKAPDLE